MVIFDSKLAYKKDDEWEEDEALGDRDSSEALFGFSY